MGSEFLNAKIASWARENLKDEVSLWLQKQWLSFDELREILEGLKGEKMNPWILMETEHRSSQKSKIEGPGRRTFNFIEEV